MRRPRVWLRWVLALAIVLAVGEYAALTWFAPRYVLGRIERLTGSTLAIQGIRLSPPFTTTLTGLRLVRNSADSGLSIERAVMKPREISFATKTLRLSALRLERPVLRVTRTHSGEARWPYAPAAAPAEGRAPTFLSAWLRLLKARSTWRVQIDTLTVIDGTIQLVDEKPSARFRGVLDHLSVDLGPIVVPAGERQVSFALRGEMVGDAGHAAPLFCSGWVDILARDLQMYCQLRPLPLAAFDPYFHGRTELRVYTSTIAATSQWMVHANAMDARIQLNVENVSEGDLSIHGRTLIDFARLTAGQEPRLSGELNVTGWFSDLRSWHGAFVPGDEPTQQLVSRLLDRDVLMVRVPLGNGKMPVSLVSANHAAMTDIALNSKEVEEALEILASPSPVTVPEATTESSAAVAPLEPQPAASSHVAPPLSEHQMPPVDAGSGTPPGDSPAPGTVTAPGPSEPVGVPAR